MSINKIKEKVRDGYLQDVPESIQNKVFTINKHIINMLNEKINKEHYEDLSKSRWAMSCLDEFKTTPTLKGEVGSVRVYQSGKQYKCMIQVTGHFTNHQYGWIEELLHEIICDTYQDVKPEVRKKFDVTLSNEGDKGSPHEGFDIFLPNKQAKEIWDLFEGRKTKTIKESSNIIPIPVSESLIAYYCGEYNKLMAFDDYCESMNHIRNEYPDYLTDVFTEMIIDNNGTYISSIDETRLECIKNVDTFIISQNLINEGVLQNIESYDQYFNEKSHGKLKYDFRRVFDVNTGHALKIVYSLDGINVTRTGDGTANNDDERKAQMDHVQKNITKLGNLDHASTGQKILAIIDRVTGKRLKFAMTIGPYTPGIPANSLELDSNHLNWLNNKDQEFKDRYFNFIEVGKIDDNSVYKSTFWPKNDTNDIKLRNSYILKLDNVGGKNTAGELLKNGRGYKLNNLQDEYMAIKGNIPKYKNPSKKDIRRNPECYRELLTDEEFEKLMKNKTPEEIKEDIESVKEDINSMNDPNSDIDPKKKQGWVSNLRKNLARLLNWFSDLLKKLGRSLGILESLIKDLPDGFFIEESHDGSEYKITDIKKVTRDMLNLESVDEIYHNNSNNNMPLEDVKQIEDHINKFINDNSNPKPIKTNITDKWAYIAPEDINKYFSHDELSEIMDIINIAKKVIKEMNLMPKYSPLVNNTHGIFKWLIDGMLFGSGYITLENHIDNVSSINENIKIPIIDGKVFILSQDTSPICDYYDEIFGFDDVIFEIFLLLDKTGVDYSNYYLFDSRYEYNQLYFNYLRELKQRIEDSDTEGYTNHIGFEYGNESLSLAVKLPKDLTLELFNKIQGMRKGINESASNTPEYNVDMTETQAKKTLRTLSQDIINKSKNKDYKITQYTANIYANIITKNLLPKWANGYKKFSITLDSYQSFLTFEFKIPTMSQDFISRFINGREPINAFLHRVPEIKIKMSPRIFHTMKEPDDAFNFFKAAVKYYDQKVEKYSKQLMSEILKLNHSMKHLVSTTSLSGIVTYPMQLLFVFDNVHMDNQKIFLLDDDDLKAINSFMKNIYTKYAAPEKEKKKIIEDVKTLVKDLREACDISENIKSLYYLPEAVENYLTGRYDNEIKKANNSFINEQIDKYDMNHPNSNELKYIREKFGVKKLKRLPTDLIAYISIETESIDNANDKLMIASYCLGKIEIVDWYIELLQVGSKKYVVPHSLPYLQNLRIQLLECYKNIMAVKVSSNKNKPIMKIDYPSRYEG